MWLSAVMLGMTIVSVWLRPLQTRWGSVEVWTLGFFATVAVAAVQGMAGWLGTTVMTVAWMLGRVSLRAKSRGVRALFKTLSVTACFVLGVQKVPGFQPFLAVPDVVISPNADPVHINFRLDAGVAGLLLLAFYTRRTKGVKELREMSGTAIAIALGTSLVVLASGFAIGYVGWDPKFPWFTGIHLIRNFLWTCVLEEAFFRGVVQDGLASCWMFKVGFWSYLPLVLASLLFGITHMAGGFTIVILASLAGLGYGYAYKKTGRIEIAILSHFSVNALHFLLLTYPFLKS